ncbi:hypothetical protein [Microbispora sp. ATCC PTA-5024]|uniref:hypothetical protein n=1 Tax=Microbispora sp. ATCC PTA-5024 TaxID=316330 RepID=UPI0003DC829B|nr:hypothetical protein [Microbispora sp. ATCC PTA-5024]ETK31802.1 hypothetical protein MPTA5024_33085 [Microbispora sp. ATCC PTA-5024]
MGRHTAGRQAGEGNDPSDPSDLSDPADEAGDAHRSGDLTFRWPDPPTGGRGTGRPGEQDTAWPVHETTSPHGLGFAALSPERLAAEHAATSGFPAIADPPPVDVPPPGVFRLRDDPPASPTPGEGAQGVHTGRAGTAVRDIGGAGTVARDGGPAAQGVHTDGAATAASASGRDERPTGERVAVYTLGGGAGDGEGRGFLGSGWREEPQPPRRLRRLALVSGLSVLLAVGVTAGGVRLMAGRTALTLEPPHAGCGTACPATPGVLALGGGSGGADASGSPDDVSSDDATGDAGATAPPSAPSTPIPTATSPSAQHTRARAQGTTPSHAPAKGDSRPTSDDASSGSDGAPDSGDTSTGTTGDGGDATPSGSAGDSTGGGDASPDAADQAADQGAGQDTTLQAGVSAGSVSLRFAVTRRDGNGYAAELSIRNQAAALGSWSVEIPVGGEVADVQGAEWRQSGDTLVLSSSEPLAQGDDVRISFEADGDPQSLDQCTLAGGECTVDASTRHRFH